MEKTFNLKSYMTKVANLDNEGSQGYFLAQQRAWMNCSKCQREKGKSAQEAWQTCFDEFQEGDRKMSWLENYASDEIANVKKESAIDYSEDVVKLASSGMDIDTAVNSALQQRLAAWPSWLGGKGKEQAKPVPASQSVSQPTPNAYNDAKKQQVNQQLQQNKTNSTVPQAKGKVSDAFQIQQQNKQTYNILKQISELINLDSYDTEEIKKIISSIPNVAVKKRLNQINQYIDTVSERFTQYVQQVSNWTTGMMKHYMETGGKAFFEENPGVTVPQAISSPQSHRQQVASSSKKTEKLAQTDSGVLEQKYVLRRYDRGTKRWAYFPEGQNGASLTTATRFTQPDAMAKAKELAGQNLYYLAVKDNENDWSQI